VLKNFILRFTDILGLSLNPIKLDDEEAAWVEKLVSKREKARKAKDYAAADKIRAELLEKGILVEDTPEGPIWRKS
jgi:cysteinyl-tRNA synthetase